MDITELLAFSAKNGASDLHLSAGLPPMIRVDGDVRRINLPAMEHKEVHALVYDIMNDKQRKDYEEFLETDFSFDVPGVARFRVNAFNQNRGAGAVFRTIPSKVLTMEDLGMGKVFQKISDFPRGIVLVTHYQRLLDYIVPDFVHVLSNGQIIKSGGKELALELEEKGYGWLTGEEESA